MEKIGAIDDNSCFSPIGTAESKKRMDLPEASPFSFNYSREEGEENHGSIAKVRLIRKEGDDDSNESRTI